MPRQIANKEELEKLLPKATEIRVVKEKEGVKLKLRTERLLYTFKTSETEAAAITKGIKTPVIDF